MSVCSSASPSAIPPSCPDSAAAAERPARVLVVEDDVMVRLALARLLRGEGYEVAEAADGDEGLLVARRFHPTLIVLDLMMPGVGGLGMLYLLRQDEALAAVPVIVHSALRDRPTIDMAEALGADAYVVKGGDVTRLLEEVRGAVIGAGASDPVRT